MLGDDLIQGLIEIAGGRGSGGDHIELFPDALLNVFGIEGVDASFCE